MFLKTNDERYYNFERIEAIWVNKTVDGDEFVIETVINGDNYTLKGKRKVCRIPDENTVKL